MSKLYTEEQIISFLLNLGFSEPEANLYLILLNSGPSTIAEITQYANIPRTSINRYIEKLTKKGFIARTIKNNSKKIIAESPNKLSLIIKEKEMRLEIKAKEIESLQNNLPGILKSLNKSQQENNKSSRILIKYYEGKEGVKSIYREAFQAKELRSYVNLGETHKVFHENDSLFTRIQKQKSSTIIKEIIDESEASFIEAKKYSKEYNFQFKRSSIPTNLNSIDILLFDGKVAMINFKHQIIGSVLENPNYYENSKTLFEFLWNSLK